MSKIYVNYGRIREGNYALPYMESKENSVKKRVNRLKNNIPACICDKYQIRQRLEQICKDISEIERQTSQLYEITNSCMEQYEAAENENSRNIKEFL